MYTSFAGAKTGCIKRAAGAGMASMTAPVPLAAENNFLPLSRIILLAFCVCLLVAQPAGAGVIFEENFEDTTAGQYSVVGDGAKGTKAFWSALPSGKLDLGFTPEGVDDSYFGGRDLDKAFGGQSGNKAQRAIIFNSVDLSNSKNVSFEISLAASGEKVFGKQDYIRLLVSFDDLQFEVIDEFLGSSAGKKKKGKNNGQLVSSINGILDSEFEVFTYALPATNNEYRKDAQSIVFKIETFTKGEDSAIAIDNFSIHNAPIHPMPEPITLALMGLGLAGIGYRRHRSKKAV